MNQNIMISNPVELEVPKNFAGRKPLTTTRVVAEIIDKESGEVELCNELIRWPLENENLVSKYLFWDLWQNILLFLRPDRERDQSHRKIYRKAEHKMLKLFLPNAYIICRDAA